MRRRMWMQLPVAAIVTLAGWTNGSLLAGNGCDCGVPEATCGCAAQPVAVCCRKHCCHHHGKRYAPVQWAAQPPAGPVVASMAAPAFTTYSSVNLVAADYGLVRPMSLVQMAPASTAAAPAGLQSTESSCQGNSARIRDLEDRIDLLQQRLTKVQNNVDEQTEILLDIAARVKHLPKQQP